MFPCFDLTHLTNSFLYHSELEDYTLMVLAANACALIEALCILITNKMNLHFFSCLTSLFQTNEQFCLSFLPFHGQGISLINRWFWIFCRKLRKHERSTLVFLSNLSFVCWAWRESILMLLGVARPLLQLLAENEPLLNSEDEMQLLRPWEWAKASKWLLRDVSRRNWSLRNVFY